MPKDPAPSSLGTIGTRPTAPASSRHATKRGDHVPRAPAAPVRGPRLVRGERDAPLVHAHVLVRRDALERVVVHAVVDALGAQVDRRLSRAYLVAGGRGAVTRGQWSSKACLGGV